MRAETALKQISWLTHFMKSGWTARKIWHLLVDIWHTVAEHSWEGEGAFDNGSVETCEAVFVFTFRGRRAPGELSIASRLTGICTKVSMLIFVRCYNKIFRIKQRRKNNFLHKEKRDAGESLSLESIHSNIFEETQILCWKDSPAETNLAERFSKFVRHFEPFCKKRQKWNEAREVRKFRQSRWSSVKNKAGEEDGKSKN